MKIFISYYILDRCDIMLFVNIFLASCFPVRAQFLSVTPRMVHAIDIYLIPLFGDSTMRTVERATRVMAVQTALLDIESPIIDGRRGSLSTLVTTKPQTLLLFWSAGCQHCIDLIERMKTRLSGSDLTTRLQVIAFSVDDASIYQNRWKKITQTPARLAAWHLPGRPQKLFGKGLRCTGYSHHVLD